MERTAPALRYSRPDRDPKPLDDVCNDEVMTGSHYPHVAEGLTEVEGLTLERAARQFYDKARSRQGEDGPGFPAP